MKFKVGDQILVTAGKEKGKKGTISQVFPEENKVLVAGINLYVKHIKPFSGQAGQRVQRERALPTANVAILNDKGQPDRVGYQLAKDGSKNRIFKKTGQVVPDAKAKTK